MRERERARERERDREKEIKTQRERERENIFLSRRIIFPHSSRGSEWRIACKIWCLLNVR